MEGEAGLRWARNVGDDWPWQLPPGPVRPGLCPAHHFHSPTTLSPSKARRTASVYIDALGLHFFSCLPTVSVLTSANISIFTHFPLQSIFVLLHVLAGPIESLLCPLHTIIHHRCYLE